jgi:hypothetical protein
MREILKKTSFPVSASGICQHFDQAEAGSTSNSGMDDALAGVDGRKNHQDRQASW